jgi:prephenate dehydratase
VADPEVGRALDDLRARCLFVKVLGSYPKAKLPA